MRIRSFFIPPRIYLDELPEAADRSLGVKVVKLVIEPAETAAEQARQSIAMARQQLSDPTHILHHSQEQARCLFHKE